MFPTDIWILIADIINDPEEFERLKDISPYFYAIFTSDAVWRFHNVDGVESGFREKFIDSLEMGEYGINGLKLLMELYVDLSSSSRKLLHYQHVQEIPPGLEDSQFSRCLVKTVCPKTVHLPDNRELAKEILNRCHPKAKIMTFPDQFLANKELLRRALELGSPCFPAIITIPEALQDDRELMMLAMANSYQFARQASTQLLADTDLLVELARENIAMIAYAPDYVRDNFDFIKTCNFEQQPWGLRHASDRIRASRSLLKILLVEKCGNSSEKIAKMLSVWSLKRREAMMISFELFHEQGRPQNWVHPYGLERNLWKIVEEYPQCYQYATPQMKNNVNFLLKVVSLDGMMLEHAPPSLQVCKRVIRRATLTNYDAVEFVPESHIQYAV